MPAHQAGSAVWSSRFCIPNPVMWHRRGIWRWLREQSLLGGAAKLILYVLLRVGSGGNYPLGQIHLERSGWTMQSELAQFTILEITCEVSVREQCRRTCMALHLTKMKFFQRSKPSPAQGRNWSMGSFGNSSERIKPPDDDDIQGEIHQE